MQNASWSPRIRKPSSIPERLSQGQSKGKSNDHFSQSPTKEKHIKDEIIDASQTKNDPTYQMIMKKLSENFKKRESYISKSMGRQFETSKSNIYEAILKYLNKDDELIDKSVLDYKRRIDDYEEEKLYHLRNLKSELETYESAILPLFENLKKNHLKILQAKRDFDKDMEGLKDIHQSEIATLQGEIKASEKQFVKTLNDASMEANQKSPTFAKKLKSLFKI
nr:14357_t:CDS:2 [Entrophospora candida]CAG8522560.1 7019_t:CDS:2 [Entrophospora candida]